MLKRIIALFMVLLLTSASTTSVLASSASDPLVGRWERYYGGNEGMIINISKLNGAYQSVIERVPERSNFKVSEIKWKELKPDSALSYKGKDLFKRNSGDSLYVDINLSITNSGELHISSIYPEGLKANSGQLQKWKKIPDSFSVEFNSWPVQNNLTSFGYLLNYTIDADQYRKVFGNKIDPHLKKLDKSWGGNCFGLAVTALLFQKKMLSLPGVNVLSSDGYNTTGASHDGKTVVKEPRFKAHSELEKIVQRYQLYSELAEYEKEDIPNYQDRFREWLKNPSEPLLVLLYWNDVEKPFVFGTEKIVGPSHICVTDTSRKVETLTDGFKRVYLYDPNYPYYTNTNKLNLPSYYKEATNRYIDINETTGEWRIKVKSSGETDELEIGSIYNAASKRNKAYVLKRGNPLTYKGAPLKSLITGVRLLTLEDMIIPLSFDGTAVIDEFKLDKNIMK